MANPVLYGICACGASTFSSTSNATHLDFCYCTTCQRVTGAPFGAWLGIKKSSVTWDGATAKYKVGDIATRSLCVQCGATLSIQYDCYPDKTHVAAGLVMKGKGQEMLPKVGVHLFVKEKPVWYDIPEDGLPRWDGFDDEFKEKLQAHKTR